MTTTTGRVVELRWTNSCSTARTAISSGGPAYTCSSSDEFQAWCTAARRCHPCGFRVTRPTPPSARPGPSPTSASKPSSSLACWYRGTAAAGRWGAPVPQDLALVPDRRGDQAGEVLDGDLLARPEVDRFWTVVALKRQLERPRRIPHVQELAGGAAVAPEGHGRLTALLGLGEPADHGGDDVGGLQGEVVARAVEGDREEVGGAHAGLGGGGLGPGE